MTRAVGAKPSTAIFLVMGIILGSGINLPLKRIPRNDTRDRLPVTDDAKIAEFGCGFPCPDTDEAM